MLLFCDIDGVLIPFPGPDGAIPKSHQRHHVTPAGRERPVQIWLNRDHGVQLAALVHATGLRPIWCTSWRADAACLIAPLLGLPPWPHVQLPEMELTTSHPHGYLWKRDHLSDYAGGEPLAWIDDDFTPDDHRWAAVRACAGLTTLLVQPDPYVGLEARHLGTIHTWAANLPGLSRDAEEGGEVAEFGGDAAF